MKIIPVNEAGDHRTGTLTGYSAQEIEDILGFKANIKDDPWKVKYSWGFMYKNQIFGIWDYKGSYKDNQFSTYGDVDLLNEIFPDSVSR